MNKKIFLALLLMIGVMATVQAQDEFTLNLYKERITALQDSVKTLQNLYNQAQDDNKRLGQQADKAKELGNDVKGVQAQIDSLNKAKADLEKKLEVMDDQIAKLDTRLYKNAFLYPTEVAYNETLIKRTLQLLDVYENVLPEKVSEKYKSNRDTYRDLLTNKYEGYTKEMENFMNTQLKPVLETNGGTIPKDKQSSLQNTLKATTYYNECYLVKDTPPYKSMPFLDTFVDKVNALLAKSGNVEQEARDLTRSLRPEAPSVGEKNMGAGYQKLETIICQFLRYPLTVAYDATLIEQARGMASQYEQTAPVQTERFAKEKANSEALYADYKRYTDELIAYMNNDVRKLVQACNGVIPVSKKAELKNKLKAQECNGKIAFPFLQNFIEKVNNLIDSNADVEDKLKFLTKSLHPND